MEKRNWSEMTDEQLLIEKKKLGRSKLMHATAIGFLAGIVIFGIAASIISKKSVALIPLIFPIYFIYRLISAPKKYRELEVLLKQRKLN